MLTLLGLILTAGTARAADEPKPPDPKVLQAAQKKVMDELARIGGPGPRVQPITDQAVLRAFPGHTFFSVLFRQYPVAVAPPKPLRSSNVFVVPKEGKVDVVTDPAALQKLVQTTLPPVRDDAAAQAAVEAWLRLSSELHQDGFFTFAIMADSTKVSAEDGGRKATGKMVVMKGGNGMIDATLTFSGDGKLKQVDKKARITAGPRPRCHATRLLDPDPIVRRIVEEDLLFMGSAAKEYLDEQRGKASPELQKAIDRIWQRIRDEER
jgi:hypothetical protein